MRPCDRAVSECWVDAWVGDGSVWRRTKNEWVLFVGVCALTMVAFVGLILFILWIIGS